MIKNKIAMFGNAHTVAQILAEMVGLQDNLAAVAVICLDKDGLFVASWSDQKTSQVVAMAQVLNHDAIQQMVDNE